MKRILIAILLISATGMISAQSPQRMNYQMVVRNSEGKLIQNGNITVRIAILQGFVTGTEVYSEIHNLQTNVNGLATLEIGGGISQGSFGDIDWSAGPYFLKTETDPLGGSSYTISGVSQLLSVPYALYAEKANVDGSETKITAGANATVTGKGTASSPYVISGGYTRITLTSSQVFSIPANVKKIKVELWGASGGGGGAGSYSYSLNHSGSHTPSYSYPLTEGGYGGSGGYASTELQVEPGQQYNVVIGAGGGAGVNAVWDYSGYWYGDTDGQTGGDSWFGGLKAAGGGGGYKGGYTTNTIHGSPGTDNVGDVTAYAREPRSNILDFFPQSERSYLHDRVLTSRPGRGGTIVSTSLPPALPTMGEAGCAVVSLIE